MLPLFLRTQTGLRDFHLHSRLVSLVSARLALLRARAVTSGLLPARLSLLTRLFLAFLRRPFFTPDALQNLLFGVPQVPAALIGAVFLLTQSGRQVLLVDVLLFSHLAQGAASAKRLVLDLFDAALDQLVQVRVISALLFAVTDPLFDLSQGHLPGSLGLALEVVLANGQLHSVFLHDFFHFVVASGVISAFLYLFTRFAFCSSALIFFLRLLNIGLEISVLTKRASSRLCRTDSIKFPILALKLLSLKFKNIPLLCRFLSLPVSWIGSPCLFI